MDSTLRRGLVPTMLEKWEVYVFFEVYRVSLSIFLFPAPGRGTVWLLFLLGLPWTQGCVPSFYLFWGLVIK